MNTEMSTRNKWTVTALLCLTQLAVMGSTPMVTIAFPRIAHDLDSSVQALQWVNNVYILVLASTLLLSATIADRIGRRRVFVAGAALLAVASVVCATATAQPQLLVGRAFQGLAAAMMAPVGLGTISVMFGDSPQRTRALAFWAAVSGTSIAIGPVAGGVLVDAFGWKSIFWVCAALLGISAVLSQRLVPQTNTGTPRAFDAVGQVLMAVALVSLVFAVVQASSSGWGSTTVIVCLVVSAASGVGLVLYEPHHPAPAVPLSLLTKPGVAPALSSSLLSMAGYSGLIFALSLYLQSVRGLTPTQAGLATVGTGVLAVAAAFTSGALVARGWSRGALLVAGLVIGGSAALILAFEHSEIGLVLVPITLFGFGYGLVADPANSVAEAALPDSEASRAASLMSTARQVGQALGLAIVALFLGSASHGTGDAVVGDFYRTSPAIWLFIAACGAAIVVVNLLPNARGAATGAPTR